MLARLARLLMAAVTVSAVLGAHSARREPAPPLRVELWGDSMGMQSAPAFSLPARPVGPRGHRQPHLPGDGDLRLARRHA